jgi:outer membrane receptor protein involved in Fe transport
MLERLALAILCASTLALSGPAFADAPAIPVKIAAGPLYSSLRALERQTGIDLLYDGDLIANAQAPSIQGRLGAEEALRQLVADTSLTVRRTQSGAWIIERRDTPPLAQQDAEVAQIVVVGLRTQNADVRRTENDVQPYIVATKKEIRDAHRDDIDQYVRSRITSNAAVVPPSLSGEALTQSAFDIRGLGTDNTLVLVDGRRMPGFPLPAFGFGQSDLNAIPIHAIERIEVLTGSAGGIHGFGALGGVINVVLDRDSKGVDLHLTEGISSRGDARRQAIEARYGFTSENGGTHFTMFASHSESDPLTAGERDYVIRDRKRTFEFAPDFYLNALSPPGNSVGVFSTSGANLVLKPEFGAADLGSSRTFLPAGFSRNAAALAATLQEHSDGVDFTLSDGDANVDLGSRPQSDALLVNLRQKFDAGLEVFADALILRSHGEWRDPGEDGMGFIAAESPVNPFTEEIKVVFPIGQFETTLSKRMDNRRFTLGFVADLPFNWRGTLETNRGEVRLTESASSDFPLTGSFLSLNGDPSDLNTNPFGDWDVFQRALSADRASTSSHYEVLNRFSQHALRLAGPVFETAEGPATLTLLAERTTEEMPKSVRSSMFSFGGPPETDLIYAQPHSNATTSVYGELRARVFGDTPPVQLLRGLELQLAVRRDDREEKFSDAEIDGAARLHARFIGTTYTAGLKVTPTRWLTLRGSYATGEQPPPINNLRSSEILTDAPLATDPKRGNTDLGSDGGYYYQFSGNPDLNTVRATTAFLGAVLTPFGEDGARFAVDISRIERTGDFMLPMTQEVLDHEEFWPERIVRLPLSDTDRELGFTGGRIHTLDARGNNGGSLEVDSIDLRAEWPVEFLGGRLRLYADGTYHMRNAVKGLFQEDERRDGFRDGPLRWRANGGFDWSNAWLSIGANVQYLGNYRITLDDNETGGDDLYFMLQGSREVPSQTYLDLNATWSLPVPASWPVKDFSLNFSVVNVLDEQPSRENSFVFRQRFGYSRYGDPRQRRFELSLSTYF